MLHVFNFLARTHGCVLSIDSIYKLSIWARSARFNLIMFDFIFNYVLSLSLSILHAWQCAADNCFFFEQLSRKLKLY